MQVFELGQMTKILGMTDAKAKNWTVGRPFKLEPSIRTASGQGSRNLYSVEDVYLMGVANELSHIGMAANAIGKFVDALKAKFPKGLADVESLYVSRKNLVFRIETKEDRVPADALVSLRVDVQGLRTRIDREVEKLK
jgi:hypothetical protein